MNFRSVTALACTMFVVLASSTSMGLAFVRPTLIPSPVPEDPTMILVALGGAGIAWQYFRSRARK